MTGERKISIVIPCYNEERTIKELLDHVLAVPIKGWKKEIIVVDDASGDRTRDILKQFETSAHILYANKNGGKGTAVRLGLAHATGSHVLIQDADLEYSPTDIPTLLQAVEVAGVDVVYGSRNLSPRTRRGALLARTGVWCITKLMNALHDLSLTDVWTCYKVFPREAADDFVAGKFESELLFTAALARRKYRFSEVPISYFPRSVSEGKKIRYRDGIYAILYIVSDWLRHQR